MPLGISFFTFQQLSFIIDRCTGKAEHYSFTNYLTFVTFFPQLIAGPIVLYKEMIPQFEDHSRRCPDASSFARGIYLFILGLAKKVLLADTFALVANYVFAQTFSLDSISTVAVILAYTFGCSVTISEALLERQYMREVGDGMYSIPVNSVNIEALKEALQRAVEEENYELASQLRDEIERRK